MTPPPAAADDCLLREAGYASRAYAESLAEFGTPVELPACGGWLLARPVPEAEGVRDGMGCYPLFVCADWSRLGDDLQSVADRLVCASVVTDPFAETTPDDLRAAFPDVCYAYKQHYVTDLSRPLDRVATSHHRRNVRKALAAVDVSQTPVDPPLLACWQELYGHLVQRHGITGIARFSPLAFQRQAHVPGFNAFAATHNGQTCGITLWYVCGDVAYYHLAAYNDRGYELGASFALFWTALTHFATLGVRWAALGAGAGATATDSGLTRFKQGWATETRPAYFCGRVLQSGAYRRLTSHTPPGLNYFPAYRRP